MMLDLNRKLKKGFKLVDPDLTTQKAYEFLAEPEIDVLIYLAKDKDHFYYITEGDINSSIKKNHKISEVPVKEISTKSLVFHYDDYALLKLKYLIKFKKNLSSFGITKPEKILVMNNGEPMGLVSDLIFNDIPEAELEETKSKLDLFIESESAPEKNIHKFYESISNLGFEITDEVKTHIASALKARIEELEKKNNSAEPEVPKLEIQKDSKEDLKSQQPPTQDSIAGLAVIYNPNHITHRPKESSPEMPERLIKIMDLLKKREKVFNSHCKLISDYPPATEEDLLRVHTKAYVEFIKHYASKGGGFLGDSTYVTKTTHELALLAVGGAFKAAEMVLDGKAKFGFGLIRPPGHHASKDKYGGYCIYNNAAILARYLQAKKGLKKILILDWDAHAANGTMNIFFDDPSVMLISIHQDPHNYYPKTGFISQLGKSPGLGYTINMEMPRGAGDEEYLTVFKELVIPLYKTFKPDFIIGCNGFDGHHSDQYTDLKLTGDGYYKFCEIFRKHMTNKMVILMEGGYNPYMGELTLTMINGLLGFPNQFQDTHLSLIQKVFSEEKIQVLLNKKLKELIYNLNRYNIL